MEIGLSFEMHSRDVSISRFKGLLTAKMSNNLRQDDMQRTREKDLKRNLVAGVNSVHQFSHLRRKDLEIATSSCLELENFEVRFSRAQLAIADIAPHAWSGSLPR